MSFTEKPLNALDVLNMRHVLSVGRRPRTLEAWDGVGGTHSSKSGSGRASGSLPGRSAGRAMTAAVDAPAALRGGLRPAGSRCKSNSQPGEVTSQGALAPSALEPGRPAGGVGR